MDSRLVLVAACSFVLGFAVAVGATCRQTIPPLDERASNSDPDADVGVALRELRAAIDRLPGAMRDQDRSVPTAPTRQSADDERPEVARLASAIDRLEKLLDASSAPGGRIGRGATQSWKGPGYSSLTDLVGVAQQRGSGREDYEALLADLKKAHSLWTTEDALDRYGPPNRIENSRGLALIYDQAPFDLGDERCWLEFYTNEGWVTSVERVCKDIR